MFRTVNYALMGEKKTRVRWRGKFYTYCKKKICTFTFYNFLLQADSGGPNLWQNPATKREVLVGIVSFGLACATEKPGINTRVGTYIDWILDVTPGKCIECTIRRLIEGLFILRHLFISSYRYLLLHVRIKSA